MVKQGDKGIGEIARELDLSETAVRDWVVGADIDPSAGTSSQLEKLVRLAEATAAAIEDPAARAEFIAGPLALVSELAADRAIDDLAEGLGCLLLFALTDARPVTTSLTPQPYWQLAAGPERARALQELDGDRGQPLNGRGDIDRLEAVQRLADLVADGKPEMAALAAHAVADNIPVGFGRWAVRTIGDAWPHHLTITIERYAMSVRDDARARTKQIENGRVGGRAKRRTTALAASLVAAVLAERPRLRARRFAEFVGVLQSEGSWGDVDVEGATSLVCSRTREHGGWRTRWSGRVEIHHAGRCETVTAAALEKAWQRRQKPTDT